MLLLFFHHHGDQITLVIFPINSNKITITLLISMDTQHINLTSFCAFWSYGNKLQYPHQRSIKNTNTYK